MKDVTKREREREREKGVRGVERVTRRKVGILAFAGDLLLVALGLQ